MLKTSYIALGKGLGNTEEDDLVRKLPKDYKYHGLGKFRWLGKVHSVDTPTWLSLLRNNKTYVMIGNDRIETTIGEPNYHRARLVNSDFEATCGIRNSAVPDTKDKLKIPIALYYMPLCKSLGIYEKNFSAG
jgi:hypothetical protein